MKIKQSIYRIFYGIFSCGFGFIFLKVLFGDTFHAYNTGMLIFYMIVGLALMGGGLWLSKKYETWLEKYYRYVLIGFLVIYGILLLYFGFSLRFTPSFDMDAIYGGAIQWLEEGSFSNYYEYYGYFPNNLGAMTFLHSVFGIASIFGIKDYFAVGIVVNTFLLVATVLVTSLACKKIHIEFPLPF